MRRAVLILMLLEHGYQVKCSSYLYGDVWRRSRPTNLEQIKGDIRDGKPRRIIGPDA